MNPRSGNEALTRSCALEDFPCGFPFSVSVIHGIGLITPLRFALASASEYLLVRIFLAPKPMTFRALSSVAPWWQRNERHFEDRLGEIDFGVRSDNIGIYIWFCMVRPLEI